MLSTILTNYDKDNRPEDIFAGNQALETKREHVLKVRDFTKKLYDTMQPSGTDLELLLFCATHHDDGRVDQYRLLGKFWDTEVSHNALGVDRFNRWLTQNGYHSISIQEQIFRDVLLYHGKPEQCFTEASKPYLLIITAADDLENASACVSYLLREVETDAKGYVHDNPEADQKQVSDFAFEHYVLGEKFDKCKYCTTYGEYIIFAATLMTSCIKKYNFAKELLMQPGYGYASILEGYRDVFEKTLYPEMAKKAYDVLVRYSDSF